jgi:cytochrome c oxidase subunit 2
MFTDLPLFPQQASVQAGQVDAIYFFMVAVTAFFSLLIAGLMVFFAFRYRRRSDDEVGVAIHGSLALELLWTTIPFFICMGMFTWGAKVFFDLYRVPAGAMEIFVVGKQWMWKVQHMGGQREINELHVPVGRPVKLIMGSEDVIHSYYIPAFRVKADVIPGRYNTMWFQATKPGRYHLFCAEYCGTRHSGMIGSVIAMEPTEYQTWLEGGKPEDSPMAAGQKLFTDLVCITCHREDSQGRGPSLANLFGHQVELQGGGKVVADEAYIRESILLPQAKIVAGYQPLMPTFQGLVTEEQLLQLISYIKSLSGTGGAGRPAAPASPGAPGTSAPQDKR